MLKLIATSLMLAYCVTGADTKEEPPVISEKAQLKRAKVDKQNAQLRLMIEQQFGEAIKKIQADDQAATAAMQADCDVKGAGKYQVRETTPGSGEYACFAAPAPAKTPAK
jgi:hypothetical protein